MRINWNEPRFGEEELREIKEVLDNAYVNEGPKSKELENKLKDYLGVKHVILTTNATAALFLAVKADAIIKDKKDFEVIVPDLTMFATATAVSWGGGRPVFVDVEEERGTIDIDKIENKITDKTIAIIPVHMIGRSADIERLQEIAEKHNLSIIEDAAGALGSKSEGKYLGTSGEVGCFSLQSNKIITCGQGGIIVTNNDRYYEEIRRLRDFGRANNKEFVHQKIGFNLKFNDLSAALALAQFRKIEDRKAMLLNQYELYKNELKELNKIKFFDLKKGEIPLWIDVIVDKREELVEYLKSKDIHPRACWPALHMNPPYSNQGSDEELETSSFLSNNVLWLPNGPGILDNQIIKICDVIKDFYKNG